MKILSIDLVGYKRFRLARLNRVQYTPTARQQLILGTNGSGKSSLLDELSPLPGHHSNFAVGGYKHITIQHGASTYTLKSDFRKGNHHSFIKDDIELNEGGTYQVQVRLVRDEFRYTDKLHDLLTGRIRFTEMRPQERREWITLLSETDWTYALGMYNQLRSRARDAQGAYKHSQQRYAQESESLLQMTGDASLQARYVQLRDELNVILTEISPGIPEYRDLLIQMDTVYQQCVRDAKRLLESLPQCVFTSQYYHLSQIEDRIQRERTFVEVSRSHITRTGDEISKLEAVVRDLGGDLQSREPVDPEQITVLESALASFQTTRFHDLPHRPALATVLKNLV
jgi:recombinational DNA repair ATPase RecF